MAKKLSHIRLRDTTRPIPTSKNALVCTKESSHALVPYKRHNPPALIGALGDLDAYLRFVDNAPILSQDEEKSLALAVQQSNDLRALQQLVISHLRLVTSIARNYLGYGLPYADLIQEGNIGLMKAISHFDPLQGARLNTFSAYWIRAEIQEFIIRNWRLVKLATTKNQRKLFFNLRQLKEDSHLALTYKQAEDIAEKLHVKTDEVLDMDTRMSGSDTSFDTPDFKERDAYDLTPADWLSHDDDKPYEILQNQSRLYLEEKGISDALKTLRPRRQQVITERYLYQTLGREKPKTLQELAKDLSVSAERIRQIEKKAIDKLRKELSQSKDLFL